MSEGWEILLRTVLMGVGATVGLDLWNESLRRFYGIPSLNEGLLGRWIGHFPQGRFVHANMAQATPVRGERIIGWSAHYLIGITFAALLLGMAGLDWARHPTPLPALVVGLVTVAAPFFIMQPSMGLGIAASKTPKPNVARLKSLASHTIYGIGLYGMALLLTLIFRP